MSVSALPPTPPPAIVRAAQLRCQAMSEAGELPRVLMTPPPDDYAAALRAPKMQYDGVRYVEDPNGVEHCVERMTRSPEEGDVSRR